MTARQIAAKAIIGQTIVGISWHCGRADELLIISLDLSNGISLDFVGSGQIEVDDVWLEIASLDEEAENDASTKRD